MKKKRWVTKMISGFLSAAMVLSTAISPMTAYASENHPEEELKAYVESLPELEQVKDQLDPEEIVTAKDYEVDFESEIDLKKDFTNLEIPDKKKVNVKYYEAKDADKKDFAANRAGTYKAVYYVEPVNGQHPAYRISRNITVKEPVTEAQTSSEGTEGSGDETSEEESDEAESEPEAENSSEAETTVPETVAPEKTEMETSETAAPESVETASSEAAIMETAVDEESDREEAYEDLSIETEATAEAVALAGVESVLETEALTAEEETEVPAETENVSSDPLDMETAVDETSEVELETELAPATVPAPAEETTESSSVAVAHPSDIRKVDVDGVVITVAAPEGAFPEGWTVKAKRISQKKSEDITEAIDAKFNGNVNKAASYTFDITILNAEGEEIQPENGKKVQVSFAMKEVESAGNLDVNVYHIEDGDQQIDKLKAQVDENTVTVTTDGFSWYTVEFTYNDILYVMPGGQSIALSKILERVELSGSVSDVSVSNSELFYPYQDKNGTWFIQSENAFHTKEWMKVTIDGIVYEITVTDATTFTPDYTTKAVVDRTEWVGFGDVGDGSTGRFHVEFTDSKGRSVKQDGYCVEPHWYGPDGTYEKVGVKELKDSKKLAKVVYYGTESMSGDDCFFKQSGNTKYSTGEKYGIVHWAAAKVYGSDEWSYCSNSAGRKAAEALIDYAESMPSIPDAEIAFSKESVTATVPSGADYQKTPSIIFKADEGNSITITLPKYVTYHDETNGKESAQSTGSTKVTIEAGTKFYFTAPLKYSGSMDEKWTVNAKGTYTKDLQAYLLDTGNERQPVAVVESFKGDRTASFTVVWLKTAKLTVVKTDTAGKRKLSGAVFGVYSDKACTDLLVKMPATDANGSSTVELETSGTVYLKELTPPKGYRISVTSEGVTVSAGETTTKTVSNEEIKGELKVYKQGQVLTGAASDANGTTFKYETAKLAGATYSVTAGADITDAAGIVVYKKGAAVATLKTNASGEATLSNLPLGPYVITETGAPVNHVNKGESKTVTLKEGSTSAEAVVGTATFNNDRQKVEVNALKQDKLTQTPVGGAVYGLYTDAEIKNNAGTVIVKKDVLIGKVTTGTDGKGKFTADLPLGNKFYIKELTAPKGYKLNGSDTYRFTTTYTNDKQVSISFSHTFENEEIRGKLTIFKEGEVLVDADVTDAGTTFKYEVRKQKGATFAVYAGAEIKSAGGKVIYKKGDLVKDGLVTGDDGSVSLDNLFLGTYTVKETGAPKNFVLNGESKDVTLSLANLSGEVVLGSVTIKNDRQKAKVTVVKQDDTTKNPLSGGIYGLYAGADIKAADGTVVVKKDTFIEKVTTGSDGNAVFKADLPLNNSYYVKELQAPKNYFRNENDVYSFTFSYTNEKQAEVAFSHTFKNERVDARIDLIKVDAETGEPQGDAKLGKATYGLYARENIVHPDGKTGVLFKAGAQVATLTTDDDGKAYISDLYLGKYFIKELIASEGYLLDEKEYDLDCAYEGDLVKTVKKTTISKEQVIKQPFQVIKAANNGKTDADLLKGVGFSAYLISSLTLKTDGSYDFSKAKPIVLTEDGKTEMFTDEKGYAVSIPIPYGKYIVRETTTPHNYTPVDDFKVTISENHPKEPQQWRVLLDDEFEAKLKIIKKDDETKKPVLLPKTEFKVYDMDHKKYVEQVTTYPSTVTHKSYFTDENGYLILPNNLKIGRYRIEEVTAPNGYVLNHNTFEVLVDSNTAYQMDQTSGDAIIEVAMENQPVKGKLTIEKAGEVLASFDKDFGYEMTSLADAEFSVYAAEDIYTPDWQRDENGNRIVIYAKDALVETVTTDAEGIAVVEDLPLGTYRIEETKAPYGFVLNTEPQMVTFAYADQETPVIEQTAEFTNDRQKVEISVEKQDVETGKKLPGAAFGLYAASAIESTDHEKVLVEADTLLEEVTSDENGIAAFTLDLPLGQYYVKEHKAPAGYVSSDEVLTFDAGYQGQDVPVVQLSAVKKNEPTTFEFTKSDITTGSELEGAVLTILTRSGDVIERWTSVKNEPHMVKCLTAGESYVLREEFAPYGYLRATDVVFTVEDTGEIQKVEMKDEVPTALLIINKKGEFLDKVSLVDNAKGTVEHMFEYISGNLTSVTFEVYAAEDIKAADGNAPDYYKKDDLIGTITTDDIGIAKLGDLPVGKYYVVEKETAYGYVLDNEPRFVDLSYRDQDTPIVVYDEKWQNARQKVAVSLWKKEKDTNTPLKGAVFGLFAVEDIKSKDGKVLIEKDALIEQKTTDADGKIAFIADLPIDGKYYLQEIAAPNGYVNTGEKKEFTFTYEGSSKDMLSYSFTFINEPTTVEISKTDITDGKELPGAHLRVIDANANVIDEWVSEEKPHIIQKLVVGREYELIETKPADGYVTAESVSFKIENTGEVQKVKMEDGVTKVRLSKSDITTGKEVPGAKLTILDEAGKVVETWTSTEEAHYIEKLPIGKYTLHEETAPAGYLVAEDVKFIVKDTGVEQKVEMKDDYTKVEISKQDITSAKEIPGAKLTIMDKDGKEIESWVSEEKPHLTLKLPVGDYTLREVTAPDGYLKAEHVKFTVKDTGEIQKVVMKDDYTKVEISKQDITNSKELPGAKLTIFDKDGKEVERWVSEEKPHYIEKLPTGEYTLREVTAPDGYEVAEDVKFTVEESGDIQHVVMKDAPKKQPETTTTPEKTTTPDNPTNPTTPSMETPKKETPTTPKTGDDRNALIWLLLLGAAGSMLGAAWYLRKKGGNGQKQD